MTLSFPAITLQVNRALVFTLIFFGMNAFAQADPIAAIKKRLGESLPRVTPLLIQPSPVSGIFQVLTDRGEVIYVDEKVQHIFAGELFQLQAQGELDNLTEVVRSEYRAEQVKAIDMSGAISYTPKGEVRGEILVFTDTDCGYCRKFHDEVPKLVEKGIKVSYFAWPRQGVNSRTGHVMENIWCSGNRQEALTTVKSGGQIAQAKACDAPISEHLSLGLKLGVGGTPAVFLKDGRQIGGYVPADKVLERMGL